ncbi:MAG: ABC transporter permease [Pseudomonadota bacterium]
MRGDFLMYIMTGIFLFLTHNRTVSSIAGAEGPTSAMMQHAPMTTFVSILSQAFSALYTQLLSLTIILFIYHVAFNKLEIVDPSSALGMFLLAWFSGCGVGIVLLAIKPWAPRLCRIIMMAYLRLNMIASGKMFVANALPPSMIALFSWSPLFHSIDQVRGFVFINYYPRNSSWDYTLYVGVILIVIGMMAEFYTRKAASASWSARQ